MKTHRVVIASLVAGIAIAACGRKNASGGGDTGGAVSTAAPVGPPAAAPTGKIVAIELNSDAAGSYFKPADVEVHRGDVLRFTLKSGVHNVDFLADSNSGKSHLPPASDMLQLPDQTLDVPVNFAPGTYYYQCDPHAVLGMRGHVKVED